MLIFDRYTAVNDKKVKLTHNRDLIGKVIWRCMHIRNGHCPCKPFENEDTFCPCKDLRVNGECDCGLYEEDDGVYTYESDVSK